MGSHFLNIYQLTEKALDKYLDLGDSKEVNGIAEKIRAQTKLPVSPDSLALLITGNYIDNIDEDGCHPKGSELIAAFEAICNVLDPAPSRHEVYIDDEKTPELWSLLMDSEDELEFEIPTSESCATTYYFVGPAGVKNNLKIFKELKAAEEFDESCLSKEELSSLIEKLTSAVNSKQGIIAFWSV